MKGTNKHNSLLKHYLLITPLILVVLTSVSAFAQQLDPRTIIERSVEANEKDWNVAPEYEYLERDRDGASTKTYRVLILFGSRYSRLIEIDDRPLPPDLEAKEAQRFEATVAQRKGETQQQRQHRISQYQKERERDHVLMGELVNALDFTCIGQQMLSSRRVYVLAGELRRGYRPPNTEAKALTAMHGTLFIDATTFHWVKAEAEVVHPVWLFGFARIEPGTRFELEQTPLAEDIWMPSHFSMKAKAKVLLLFQHNEQEDDTYSSYQKASSHVDKSGY